MFFLCTFHVIRSVVVMAIIVAYVQGHGRLVKPVARSSAWRRGYSTLRNNNDNALNCGGFGRQFTTNFGQCGLCGDAYDEAQPRRNEGGGKYGQGVVVNTYSRGEVIDVTVEITANHRGTFTYQLCPTNNPLKPANETCFRNHNLKLENGANYYTLLPGVSKASMRVQLPDDVICSEGCVFRWKWKAGNNWGCDGKKCGIGRGKQEHFYGCSDIVIIPRSYTPSSSSKVLGLVTSIQTTALPSSEELLTMHVTSSSTGANVTLQSTNTSTTRSQINCYSCQVKRAWYLVPGMLKWCVDNCFFREKFGKEYGVDDHCECLTY